MGLPFSMEEVEKMCKDAKEKIDRMMLEKNNPISNAALWGRAFDYVLTDCPCVSHPNFKIIIPTTKRTKDVLDHFIAIAENHVGLTTKVLQRNDQVYRTDKIFVEVGYPDDDDLWCRGQSIHYIIFGDKNVQEKMINMVRRMRNVTFITVNCDENTLAILKKQ